MGSDNSNKDKTDRERLDVLTSVQKRLLNGIYEDFFGNSGSGSTSKDGGAGKNSSVGRHDGSGKSSDAAKNNKDGKSSGQNKDGSSVKSDGSGKDSGSGKSSGAGKGKVNGFGKVGGSGKVSESGKVNGTSSGNKVGKGSESGKGSGANHEKPPVYDMQAHYDDALQSARDALLEARRLIEDDELGLGTSGTLGMSGTFDMSGMNLSTDGIMVGGMPVGGMPVSGMSTDNMVAYNGGAQPSPAVADTPPEPEEDPMEQLDRLVGLTAIKHDVREMADFAKLAMIRKEKGLKSVPVSMHLVFTGNPGTGKTTVARILAKIYKNIGVLSKGQLVEVDRSGLVAGYVGQTALKTQDVIKSALGGVLFIDEAYALSQKDDNFGQEAIDTILKAMEDNRDDFIVIVAGYTKPMEKFINSNPGLKSRFNKYIEFPDYSIEELEKIFYMNCDKYDYKVSEDAKGAIKAMILTRKLNNPINFANAREVRNMFEDIITNQARRIVKMEDPKPEDICTICLEDLTEDDASDNRSEYKSKDANKDESKDASENTSSDVSEDKQSKDDNTLKDSVLTDDTPADSAKEDNAQ